MIQDAYQLMTSTDSKSAAVVFAEAVNSLAGHRPDTARAITRVLEIDPDHVAAHALNGFANLILARAELVTEAVRSVHAARSALAKRDGGTSDERILIEALEIAVDGHFAIAADKLEREFSSHSAALLPFKIAHSLRFMLGDAAAMLEGTRRMMSDWNPLQPGAGFMLGCHAFALEELGHYDEAEDLGSRAIALQPDDAWGMHAVSHVYEMRGETPAGIAWLEQNRDYWSRCNNFSFHIAWHLALLHLQMGDHDLALSLYDREVRPVETDDFRDMANAVSLLRRLEYFGVDVGNRWEELAEIAQRRRDDITLVFASLHTLIALRALGDRGSMSILIDQLEAKAYGTGEQSHVARTVGVPLARVIVGDTSANNIALDRLAQNLPQLGGSNAQRDLFLLELARFAVTTGNDISFSRIHSMRKRLKANDLLIASIEGKAALSARSLRSRYVASSTTKTVHDRKHRHSNGTDAVAPEVRRTLLIA